MFRLNIPSFGRKESPGHYEAGIWEKSGKTPKGQQDFNLTTRHCRDCEDSDTVKILVIGSVIFREDDDHGRDYASVEYRIESKSDDANVSYVSHFGCDRGGGKDSYTKGDKDLLLKAVKECAAKEEMTPSQFASELPAPFATFVGDFVK